MGWLAKVMAQNEKVTKSLAGSFGETRSRPKPRARILSQSVPLRARCQVRIHKISEASVKGMARQESLCQAFAGGACEDVAEMSAWRKKKPRKGAAALVDCSSLKTQPESTPVSRCAYRRADRSQRTPLKEDRKEQVVI